MSCSNLRPISPDLPQAKRAAQGSKKPENVKDSNLALRIPDRVMLMIFSLCSLSSLGSSASVDKRWHQLVGWKDDQLWTQVKLQFPNLKTFNEASWRENFDCATLGLDPSGAPQIRKATLKAVVAFIKIIPPSHNVYEVTLPKGLCRHTATHVGSLGEALMDEGQKAITKSMFSDLTSVARMDHNREIYFADTTDPTELEKRLRAPLTQTMRIFTTFPDSFARPFEEGIPDIGSLIGNALVRPLPLMYDLPGEREFALLEAHPLHLSFPYLRFYVGTPNSQRVDYAPRGYQPLIRVSNDAGTDYSQEKPYIPKTGLKASFSNFLSRVANFCKDYT